MKKGRKKLKNISYWVGFEAGKKESLGKIEDIIAEFGEDPINCAQCIGEYIDQNKTKSPE